MSCMEQCIADSSIRIEHVSINNEIGVFAERQHGVVLESDLQPPVSSCAKLILYMHR